MAKTLFPHQKLEWNIKRLKEELESKGTDSSKQTLSDLAGSGGSITRRRAPSARARRRLSGRRGR